MLPVSYAPTSYHISIAPNEALDAFCGRVVIRLEQRSDGEAAPTVELNAHKLTIKSIRVNDVVQDAFSVSGEVLSIALQGVVGGAEVLEIEYDGIITDDSVGLYRNKYASGKKTGLATQLFATYARRVFPCWDEPSYKAVFHVDVTVDKELQVYSNAPLDRTELVEHGAKQRWVFKATPKMSCYLVALLAGAAERVTELSASGRAVSVLAPPGQAARGRFAAQVGARAVDFFEKFFGCPLPVEKVDMAGLESFLYGGMENWGLIFYPTHILLVEQDKATYAELELCASVVCHEIAHNWFGNLVTIKYFHFLWLSEGFATFMGWKAVENQFPEWDVPCIVFTDETSRGLDADERLGTHPVELDSSIVDPSIVLSLIDNITYCKGMCCVMMAKDFVGADAFEAGVQAYLKKHAFSNATTQDLWKSLGIAADMDRWVATEGHPLVSVSLKDDCTVHVSQRRFRLAGVEDGDNSVWPINLTIGTGEKVSFRRLFREAEMDLSLDEPLQSYLLLNQGAEGFYRVLYSDHLWVLLLQHVDEFSAVDMMQLLSNCAAVARSGDASVLRELDLVDKFRSTGMLLSKPHLALQTLAQLRALSALFKVEGLTQYVKALSNELLDGIGECRSEGELPKVDELRRQLRHLCWERKKTEYLEQFKSWRDHKDNAELIFKAAAKEEGSFDSVLAISREPDVEADSNLKRIILFQLAANAKDLDKLEQLLMTVASSHFVGVFCRVPNRKFLVDFCKKHWDHVFKMAGGTAPTLGHVFLHAFSESSAAQMTEFFSALPESQQNLLRDRVDRARESIDIQQRLKEREQDAVAERFKA